MIHKVKTVGLGAVALIVGFALWPAATQLWQLSLEAIVWPIAGGNAGSGTGTGTWILLSFLLGSVTGLAAAMVGRPHSVLYGAVVSAGAASYPVGMWFAGVIEVSGIYYWWLHEAAAFIILPPLVAAFASRQLANHALKRDAQTARAP